MWGSPTPPSVPAAGAAPSYYAYPQKEEFHDAVEQPAGDPLEALLSINLGKADQM